MLNNCNKLNNKIKRIKFFSLNYNKFTNLWNFDNYKVQLVVLTAERNFNNKDN